MFLFFIASVQEDDCQHGRALCDIRKGDHRPQVRAAEISNQLQVDGIGHMMKPCDDKRRIQRTEEQTEQPSEVPSQSGIDDFGNPLSDRPTDRAQHRMRDDDSRNQGQQRNHNHRNVLRNPFTQPNLQVGQYKPSQHGRNDLRLIADLVDREGTEIPEWNLFRASDTISIQ